jgi:ribonuclease E
MSEETMENEVETNPLQDMIQHAIDQDFNKANDLFNSMMTVKMSDLLDQEKVNLAGQIYNGEEPDEEDDDQLELDLEAEDDSEEEEEWDDEEEDEDNSSEEELEDENSSQ